jgi:hypothetical protein
LKYIKHLREGHRKSPRFEADADHVKVKTEMLQLRLMEKKKELVRMDEVNEMIDVVLTAMSCMPAQSGDPAQHRARRVRDSYRDRQRLPRDGRQVG